jgi:rSAM/selenodomain-associated transferase 2
MSFPFISIIIPVLNDASSLGQLLAQLQSYRQDGHEVVVVDGGSRDGSMTVARKLSDRVLISGTGRSRQMNLGADNASHDILLFLHADAILPPEGLHRIPQLLADPKHAWGRFDVYLDQPGLIYGLIAWMMNRRSRLTGVATGDQGIFVHRDLFHRIGGYRDISLMEDVAISKDLLNFSRPLCLQEKLGVSARRWHKHGVLKTIAFMWYLRLGYFLGRSPEKLAKLYYPAASDESRSSDNV